MSLIAELYEDNMLVRLLPIDRPHYEFRTPRLLPPRFVSLEKSISDYENELVVSDTWRRKGYSETRPPWNPLGDHGNWVTAEFWVVTFGKDLPEDCDRSTYLIPVTWVRYEKIR